MSSLACFDDCVLHSIPFLLPAVWIDVRALTTCTLTTVPDVVYLFCCLLFGLMLGLVWPAKCKDAHSLPAPTQMEPDIFCCTKATIRKHLAYCFIPCV